MCKKTVQTARRMCKHGCTGYVHIKLSHVNVMRRSLSLSLEPDGLREEAPPQSLSFCHHAPEALRQMAVK